MYKAEFCGFWTHKYLTTLRIDNIVVNPADVLIKSSEMLRKSDAVDRCRQAWSLQGNKLKGIYTPDSISLVMCSLIRLKNSITKDTTRQKNRIKSQLRYLVIEMTWKFLEPFSNWLKPFVVWLKGGGRCSLRAVARPSTSIRPCLSNGSSIFCQSSTSALSLSNFSLL